MTARKPKAEINHKNNDPTDNTLDNLEFRTPAKIEGQPYDPDPLHPINTPDGKDHRPGADGVAMNIRHGNEMLGVWDRMTPYRYEHGVDLTRWGSDRLAGQRPYVLESALVEQTLRRQRDAAQSEIEAVEADMLAIETQANNEIADIRARTDTELAARRARKDDLRRIVDMTGRALELEPAPATNADVQDELLAMHIEEEEQTMRDMYHRSALFSSKAPMP